MVNNCVKAAYVRLNVSYTPFLKHLGQLAKGNCSEIFADRGCEFCMTFIASQSVLGEHQKTCCPSTPSRLVSYDL